MSFEIEIKLQVSEVVRYIFKKRGLVHDCMSGGESEVKMMSKFWFLG